MSEILPLGWTAAPLEDLISELITGRRPKGGVRGITEGVLSLGGEHVSEDGTLKLEIPRYVPLNFAETIPHARIEEHDILVVKDGATTGKVGFVSPGAIEDDAYINEHLFICRHNPDIAPQFLFHYLRSHHGKEGILSDFRGAAQGGISREFATKTIVPVAPLAEQQRIVAKLDALLARSTRARDELAHIPRLIERYKQAVLAAAFRGELTAEWRDTPKLEGWQEIELGELLTGIQAGKNLRCEERPPQPDEQGVVKVSAVTWGRFQPAESKTFLPGHVPDPRFQIQHGDFLISRANTIELVGACVVVENAPGNLFLSDKVLRLSMPEVLKPWILFFLRSSGGRRQIESASTGNQLSMRNISQDSIRALRLPLPPSEERAEITSRLVRAMRVIATVEEERATAERLRSRLEEATLAKAFRGELVPQDPNDEPASVLLERIRTERDLSPGMGTV